MNRFKGPELKLSELKLPAVLRDLYSDLRDRRLLPLIGLVLVAIVATPFLLGGGGKPLEPAPVPVEGHVEEASLAVMPAEPGLREPSKRLAGLQSKDPFRAHYTSSPSGGSTQASGPVVTGGSSSTSVNAAPAGGTSTGGTVEGGSTGAAPSPTPAPESSGGGGAPAGGGGSGGQATQEVPHGGTLYTLAVTLQVTRIETKPDGSLDKKGPTTYKEVLAPTPLPGEKTPVITYLGMGAKHHEPLFLVSNEVTAIFGEANCISGAGTCQLLVLEKGFPVTFVYGDNNVRYKIDLLEAKPVLTGHS